MIKKILSISLLVGVFAMIAVWSIKADTLVLDSSIASKDYSTVHFNSKGNDFQGLFVRKGETILATWHNVVLSWVTKVCYSQLKWYYYNSQRGNRWRPIDDVTLASMTDSTYSGLVIQWGFFTRCSWDNDNYVYGQINHIYSWVTYKLLAWVNYNISNGDYYPAFSWSLLFTNISGNYAVNNYIRDINGGLWYVVSNKMYFQWNISLTGIVSSGTLVTLENNNTVIYSTWSDNLVISWNQFVVTGGDWNGIIVPPTTATWTWVANLWETWFVSTWVVLFSIQAWATGSNLISSWWMFIIDLLVSNAPVGKVLFIYRSQDGNIWTGNTPDATCTLDSNKRCIFRTDHLSFFAWVGSSCTWAPSNASYTDPILCTWSCNSSYSLSWTNLCISNPSNWWWSYRLVKDNCKWSSSNKNNLPWANEDGIDYSKSYYDKDCWDSSDIQEKIDVFRWSLRLNALFSNELNDAYVYAYAKWITTMDTIETARMKSVLSRRELAKMISEYSTNVVWLEPNNNSACWRFTDIWNETSEFKGYIKEACQLWLMWLNSDGSVSSKFNPNWTITRAHFWTVLSRLLWWDKYNWKDPYYVSHLAALKTRGIIKYSDPTIKELRWRVMLMMMRSDENGIWIMHASWE